MEKKESLRLMADNESAHTLLQRIQALPDNDTLQE